MKCLSVRQPWAEAIVMGYKDIENRSWKTNYRGELYIHASVKIDLHGIYWIKENFKDLWFNEGLNRSGEWGSGAIIGKVELVDCVTEHTSKWYDGRGYGFVLKSAKKLKKPIIVPGKLGIWTYRDSILKPVDNIKNRSFEDIDIAYEDEMLSDLWK
jgi:hypothetical protein